MQRKFSNILLLREAFLHTLWLLTLQGLGYPPPSNRNEENHNINSAILIKIFFRHPRRMCINVFKMGKGLGLRKCHVYGAWITMLETHTSKEPSSLNKVWQYAQNENTQTSKSGIFWNAAVILAIQVWWKRVTSSISELYEQMIKKITTCRKLWP